MTDADFLLEVLSLVAPGSWVSHETILMRSQRELGHGMTVHSRAADLRKRGHIIECKVEKRNGRAVSFYRLSLAIADPPLRAGSATASESVAKSSPPELPTLSLFESSTKKEVPAWA